MKKKRFSDSSIFTISSRNAKLTETHNKKVIQISQIKTYQIKKNNKTKKFEIYEISRRKKPKRVKTLKIKKGQTITSVRQDAQAGKILFKAKYKSAIKTSLGKAEIIQTNYLANLKAKNQDFMLYPQMVGLVVVQDLRRGIVDNILAYSRRMNSNKPTSLAIDVAEQEIISMAIGKFISLFGMARASGDIVAQIVDRRFQYWKKK